MAQEIILLENQNLQTIQRLVNDKLVELFVKNKLVSDISYFYGNKHVVMITTYSYIKNDEDVEIFKEVVEDNKPEQKPVEELPPVKTDNPNLSVPEKRKEPEQKLETIEPEVTTEKKQTKDEEKEDSKGLEETTV